MTTSLVSFVDMNKTDEDGAALYMVVLERDGVKVINDALVNMDHCEPSKDSLDQIFDSIYFLARAYHSMNDFGIVH